MERLLVDEHVQILSILFDSWKVSGEYEGVVLGCVNLDIWEV